MSEEAVRLREQGTDEARLLLIELAERNPRDAVIAYQTAWAHDSLGFEAEAAPYYERALATEGLSTQDRHGVFVGLGSTYRVLGRYEESLKTLRRGLDEFPGDAALRTFLAMALYNVGEARDAAGTLLKVLAETSTDAGVQRYRRAIEYYADHLDDVE